MYLDRYWRQERQVAADLILRSAHPVNVDTELLAAGLERLFTAEAPDLQRLAAAVAVLRRFAVIAGGPGTGKTTTVARILALLDEQAAATGVPPPKVALAAPTGKAAARLQESVHAEAATLDVTRRRPVPGSSACGRRPSTASSAGAPTAPAASATTGPTGCPSTRSSSTRRRWCPCP